MPNQPSICPKRGPVEPSETRYGLFWMDSLTSLNFSSFIIFSYVPPRQLFSAFLVTFSCSMLRRHLWMAPNARRCHHHNPLLPTHCRSWRWVWYWRSLCVMWHSVTKCSQLIGSQIVYVSMFLASLLSWLEPGLWSQLSDLWGKQRQESVPIISPRSQVTIVHWYLIPSC